MVTKGKIFVKSQMGIFFFHLSDFVELKQSIKSIILLERNRSSCNKIKCIAQTYFFIIGFQSYLNIRIICEALCTLNIYSFICQLYPDKAEKKNLL